MPTPDMFNKPGDAPVKQVGHTIGRYGVTPTAKPKGNAQTTDISWK